MAIVKKFDPKQIFVSRSLEKRLNTLYEYPVTVVEAPTGYGKTTIIREFLKKSGKPFIWFNVDTSNKNIFFDDFCKKIKSINEKASKKLREIGYPNDFESCKKIVSILIEVVFYEKTIFVIDNYNFVSDEFLNSIIKDLTGSVHINTSIVCITQAVDSNSTFDLIVNRKINYFGKNDFELSKEEIIDYFKLCGIKLEDDEATFLYEYTEGWISALYLQMLSYVSTSSFEPTVDIENLIGKAFWNNLDRISQDFLIGLSVFKSFTLRQSIYIGKNSISEQQINDLLKESGFIRYDSKDGKYYIHSILRYFLENEFEKLETIFKKDILKKAGDWYRDNENYIDAILFYYKTGNVNEILSLNISTDVLYRFNMTHENKKIFYELISSISADTKEKYFKTYMQFVFFLFINNEKDLFKKECSFIKHVLDSEEVADHYNRYLGEYYVLDAFLNYNNIDVLKETMDVSFEILKGHSLLLTKESSLIFSSPSPLHSFHRSNGNLRSEVQDIENLMPVFYRLSDGQSKGLEALVKAEMLLYEGDFNDSYKLCEKALYMSSLKEKPEIHVKTLFTLARISYLTGDIIKLKEFISEITNLCDKFNTKEMHILSDIICGYIHTTVNNEEKIPLWLTDTSKIEENTDIFNLGFTNIVYGKYMLIKGEYDLLASVIGQHLKVADIYSNLLNKIYILIYLSIIKYNTGETVKAVKILKESVELAINDNLYIPFVENINFINNYIKDISFSVESKQFVDTVISFSKKFNKSIKISEKTMKSDNIYGLTKREEEVAKLAGERMTNKEIAEMLFIAESTVKSNLKSVFNKMGINSRTELKNFF